VQPNAEATYDALNKYGQDIVKLAEEGKLDPVIGRDAEIRSVPGNSTTQKGANGRRCHCIASLRLTCTFRCSTFVALILLPADA